MIKSKTTSGLSPFMICWISILMVVTSRVVDSSRVRLIRWIVRHPFCTAATSSSSRKITWFVCSIIALQNCQKKVHQVLPWNSFVSFSHDINAPRNVYWVYQLYAKSTHINKYLNKLIQRICVPHLRKKEEGERPEKSLSINGYSQFIVFFCKLVYKTRNVFTQLFIRISR